MNCLPATGAYYTVTDLQDVANGINSLRAYPAGDVAEAMLAVAARGSLLIEDLIENAGRS
jgi:hypothetical protein